jgi:hydroxymethylglutaryl-CoA lyase
MRFSSLKPFLVRGKRVVTHRLTSRCLHHVAPLCVPDSVKIVEVGPRDGLQNEALFVSVEDKVQFIQKLAESGCSYIEAGSFVSPKAVPAMANSLDVMKQISDPMWRKHYHQDLTLSCLVPTLKYFHHALEGNVDEIAIFASASETFSQKVRYRRTFLDNCSEQMIDLL